MKLEETGQTFLSKNKAVFYTLNIRHFDDTEIVEVSIHSIDQSKSKWPIADHKP